MCVYTCSGMSSVYTFGPTFRAERSHTRRHLSEFYMVEAETVTLPVESGLHQLMELSEQLCKSALEEVVKRNEEDLKLFHEQLSSKESKVIVERKEINQVAIDKLSFSRILWNRVLKNLSKGMLFQVWCLLLTDTLTI